MTVDHAALEKLREVFPPGTVGVLPKPYKKTSPKGKCDECGGYHGLPAAHLDFVGHAAVTDRLLSVDPEWTWEPLSLDYHGLPALDRDGNLWIKLTICGVTRIGVGDGPSMKERIGDALRNAAMRFGVALSLWTKDELESGHAEDKATPPTNRRASGTVRRAPNRVDPETGEIANGNGHRASPNKPASDKQIGLLKGLAKKIGADPEQLKVLIDTSLGRETAGWSDLSSADASLVIDQLQKYQPAEQAPESAQQSFGHGEEPF